MLRLSEEFITYVLLGRMVVRSTWVRAYVRTCVRKTHKQQIKGAISVLFHSNKDAAIVLCSLTTDWTLVRSPPNENPMTCGINKEREKRTCLCISRSFFTL